MAIDWGLALGAVSVVAIPVGFGIGMVAMASPSPGEFRFARICFIVAALAAVASFVWLTQEMPLNPTKFLVAGLTGALVTIGLVTSLDWVNRKQSPEIKTETSTGELLLECQLAPLPEVGLPNQSMLFKIDPFRFTDLGTIGYGTAPSEPGKPFNWPDEWKNKTQSSARCRVTNYGKSTLFNVQIPFEITFVRLKRGESPGSTTGNEIINVADGIVPVTKLDPGSDAAYVFYIHNQGRDIVYPRFADAATCQPLGASSRTSIKIIQPSDVMHNAGALWPVRDAAKIVEDEEKAQPSKSPPAQPPPVPAPLDKQEKK